MAENCCCGCDCTSDEKSKENQEIEIGEYVCYCSHVTEQDIIEAIKAGALSVDEVIEKTGAMQNCNCAVNNPKGTCCYPDVVYVFEKHR